MNATEQELANAYLNGKEVGVEQERRRVRLALMTIERKTHRDFPKLDLTNAAFSASGWNAALEFITRTIGVSL